MSTLACAVERLRSLLQESVAFDRDGLSRKKASLLYLIRLSIQVGKGLVRDKCLQQASSLAFKTVMSIVPLAAVALSLLNAFGGMEGSRSAVVLFLSRHFLAGDPERVAGYVTGFTEKLSFGAIGGVGVTFLFVVAVSLFDTIEKTLNDVWKSKRRRGLLAKFTTFYAVITLGPLLIALSLYQSAKVQAALDDVIVGQLSAYLGPVLVTWVMLVLCYKLFPTARVRWWPAMVGAALAAVGFEAVKWGFNVYVAETLINNYNKIYGAIALFPVFLVWVYVAWIIVLFGAEWAFTLQNLSHLVREERRRSYERMGEVDRRTVVNEFLAVRVAVAVAARWDAEGGSPTTRELAGQLAVPTEAVAEVVEGLVRREILVRQGDPEEHRHLPGRPIDRIRVGEIVAGFRKGYLESGRGHEESPVEERLLAAEEAFVAAFKGVMLQDLVRDPRALELASVEVAPQLV